MCPLSLQQQKTALMRNKSALQNTMLHTRREGKACSPQHIVCPIVHHCLFFLLYFIFPFFPQLLTLYLHYLSESMVLHYLGKSIERLNDPTNRDFCDLPFLEVVSLCSSDNFRSSWDEILVCVCGIGAVCNILVLESRLLAQSLRSRSSQVKVRVLLPNSSCLRGLFFVHWSTCFPN